MGRAATKQQRTPISQAHTIAPMPPLTTAGNVAVGTQQQPSIPATQEFEPKRPTITEEDVRRRAYQIYLERGQYPGDEADDWLRAKRELLAD